MKNVLRIAGMLLILLVAGQNIHAQRGMRGFGNDSTFMELRHDSAFMKMRTMKMMHSMGPAWGGQGMMNAGACCGSCMNPGMMRHGMRHQEFQGGQGNRMMGRGPMMQNAPGRRIMESMPGVTAKQKEELTKLNEKQISEMKKLREQHLEAMKTLHENHRKNVMNLLTDEQKKWIEERASADKLK